MVTFNKNNKKPASEEEKLTRAEDICSAVGIGLGYLTSVALPLWVGWEIGEQISIQMNLGTFSDYLTQGVSSIALTTANLKYLSHYFSAAGFITGLYTGTAIDSVKNSSKRILESIVKTK